MQDHEQFVFMTLFKQGTSGNIQIDLIVILLFAFVASGQKIFKVISAAQHFPPGLCCVCVKGLLQAHTVCHERVSALH